MASAAEAAKAKQGIAANLAVGVQTLDEDAEITFDLYQRLVLPMDGYVFWVKATLVTPQALYNSAAYNTGEYNRGDTATPQPLIGAFGPWAGPALAQPRVPLATTLTVQGSLHYAITKAQDEDESIAVNQVIFSALKEVNDLDRIAPDQMYIAYIGPEQIPYAFSMRGRYYEPADLFHYVGDAVYPAMRSQIISAPPATNVNSLIVSDSLPAWLALNTYVPPYPTFVTGVTLYPSFAVPDNLAPPYGVVHIDPGSIASLQGAPAFNRTLSQAQLSRERVRITLYGLNNLAAQTFAAAVEQYSYDWNYFGLMCMSPVPRDEKRTQRELGILAQKKTLEYDICYSQNTMRDVARQIIEQAFVTFGGPLYPVPPAFKTPYGPINQ